MKHGFKDGLRLRALVAAGLGAAALGAGAAPAPLKFYTVTPCRALDTRSTSVLSAGVPRPLALAGMCGTPPTAASISLNVSVTGPNLGGFVVFFPAGTSPTISTINFNPGQTRTNNAIVAVGTAGTINMSSGQPAGGTVNVIVDVNGYFDDPANNQPPHAKAGPDQTISLPAVINLAGAVDDDGLPTPPNLVATWSKVSGPGTVVFGDINAPVTTATVTVPGTYVFQLFASDGQLTASDSVSIDVNPAPSPNPQADVVRFLEQATWGPTDADIALVQSEGFVRWLNDQFSMPASSYPDMVLQPTTPPGTCNATCQRDNYSMYLLQTRYFTNAMYGPDQLRQRVSWALHKLLVTSGLDISLPAWMTPYLQMLDRNAFGNFRNLLYELTLNPAMGRYLDSVTSTKNSPNENYGREVLQLFSVGTVLLNVDGTTQNDVNGPIATYSQDTVTNFAKIFTGWSFATQPSPGIINYKDPMLLVTNNHDTGAKTLLSGLSLPGLVTPASSAAIYQELDAALDNIFGHPNVGPYVSRELIHGLTTSNPSPAYIGRVAAVFNNNGSGARGDLRAVVEAILLDPEARGDVAPTPDYGRLKEPVQLATNLLRAFNAKAFSGTGQSDGYIDALTTTMGQDVFRPPTVFSYYPQDYLLPGSTTELAPEFGLITTQLTLKRANFVNTLVYTGITVQAATSPLGTSLDYGRFLTYAGNTNQLVDELNKLLLHGTMSPEMKSSIVLAVEAYGNIPANAKARVQQAVYLITTSSQYQVQR